LAHIKKVVLAVESGKADFGVVPLENYYNGEVIQTLDALTHCAFKTRIIMEKPMQIVHCLGALKNHGVIKNIFSKDQALEQCEEYLTDNYPLATPIAVSSTSEAVERIVKENLLDSAAIASKSALLNAGLIILAEDICPNNITRFIGLAKESIRSTNSTGNDKTFMVIHPPRRDKPGTLFHCLAPLKAQDINLEDARSRPDRKGGYYFYLEFSGHKKDIQVAEAMRSIKGYLDVENKFNDAVRILGSYPNTHWKDLK
jgi:chorismate mutase/prephenate dehydratase